MTFSKKNPTFLMNVFRRHKKADCVILVCFLTGKRYSATKKKILPLQNFVSEQELVTKDWFKQLLYNPGMRPRIEQLWRNQKTAQALYQYLFNSKATKTVEKNCTIQTMSSFAWFLWKIQFMFGVLLCFFHTFSVRGSSSMLIRSAS